MGHNWLAVLTGTNGTPVNGDANSWKNGPGGCSRCHFTGAWKQTLTELNGSGNGATGNGSGVATLTSLGLTDITDGAWNGTDGEKKANNIECMLCHSGNYNPPQVSSPKYDRTAEGLGVEFGLGGRKPAFYDGSNPGWSANFVLPTNPLYMGSTKWSYDGSTWSSVTTKIYMAPDFSANALSSISKTPTNEACTRCHNYAGGGARNKRGMWFRPNTDVHSNLNCLDCHKTEKDMGGTSSHKLSIGISSDTWARDIKMGDLGLDATKREDHPSECSNSGCHGPRPHSNKTLNDHFSSSSNVIGDGIAGGKVDCRTCHIPYQYGQELKDFTATTFSATTGLYDTKVYNRTDGNNNTTLVERPTYKWFNTISDLHKHGPQATTRSDSNAKITTFTRYEFKSIVDAAYNKIPIKAGIIAMTGNVFDAAKTGNVPLKGGIEANNMDYYPYNTAIPNDPVKYGSNAGKANTTLNWTNAKSNFLIGHRVAPKVQALTCVDCHNTAGKIGGEVLGGVLFTDLGYTAEEAEFLKKINQ